MLATRIEEKKREEGFTLIELLVVVIIIGILAAIAIPVFLNQRESAWRSSAESDARNAAIAMETAYTRLRNVYPMDDDANNTATMDNFEGDDPIWFVDEDGVIAVADDATDPVLAEIAVSSGVLLEYYNEGNSYVIAAYHTQIDEGDEVVAVYDSSAGGIQPDPLDYELPS